MDTYTTIQVTPEVREKLLRFKEYGRESYNEVLTKLMSIAELAMNEGEMNNETIDDVKTAKKQYAKGEGFSTRELLKKLGV